MSLRILHKKYAESILKNFGKWPDKKFDPEQLEIGVQIEKEHTEDPAVAEQIAKDHLDEIPDYYTRLVQMEEEAKKAMPKKSMMSEADIKKEEQEEAAAKPLTTADVMALRKFILSNDEVEDYDFHNKAESLGVNVHAAEEAMYQFIKDLAAGNTDAATAGDVEGYVMEESEEGEGKEASLNIKTYLSKLL